MGLHLSSGSTADLVHKWQPNTPYLAGDIRMAPDGTIVSRNSNGTSGTTYSGANWTTVAGSGAVTINGTTGTTFSLTAATVGADPAGAAAAVVVPNEVEVVVYASGTGVGVTRPGAEFVVWQGFPTQPTNMADGDLWLSDLGGTILNGTAAPTSTDGANGDFYIRTSTSMLYGPKASGSWPAGVSLVGTAGTNGRGITSVARTSGTGAAGTTDTYTITYSDSTTSTFTVYNGADGAGAGITVQDEGGALATAATTINFVGSGVTASGTGATKTVTIAGGGGAATAPAPIYTMPTGAVRETADRTRGAWGGVTLTSGTVFVAGFNAYAGDVLSTINVRISTSITSSTHAWAVLMDSGRNVLAVSADNTAASFTSNTNLAFTFGSAYTVGTSGLFYAGVCFVATTPGALLGPTLSNAQPSAITPAVVGTSSTGQTTPPSVAATLATVVNQSSAPYFWLT